MENAEIGITESFSRNGRLQVANLIFGKITQDVQKQKEILKAKGERSKTHALNPYVVMAEKLGVSDRVIYLWIKGDFQASDITLKKMLKLASELNLDKLIEIITNDLSIHEKNIEKLIREIKDFGY